MSVRRSGLQRDVLALYRRALRMVNTKPPNARPKFLLFVRFAFRTSASNISPRNVSAIEHLLRKGGRQLEMYEDDAVKDCWVSSEMLTWAENWKASSRTPSDSSSVGKVMVKADSGL
ncbi:Succinate dehydrogenase assembly factor 1, mitochondrial [Hypsizygus marmoreus]|uniref:Succinate dehydrogenase assembly factor 1, mitochondrial n=1 Tax=Hypsizygus marmoreus TaxID=39966 RepID=A0A369JBL9_HYPMA|nr:Succinate dehydrogenase assembly factor 1, mitochondrial [Hypsizygus marmoreus]